MISGSKIYKPYNDGILEEDMEKYEGKYVIIHNKKVVEDSKSISEIIKLSEKYPIDEAIITKIFPPEENLF